MMKSIIFSIIIPTYNSQKTISKTLKSINAQTFNKNSIEVLIVDGGSNDRTLAIAQEYNFVTIVNNPKRLPEYAKLYGIQRAKGKYVIKMDSDEAFSDENALEKRFGALKNNDIPLLVADKLLSPKRKRFLSATPYINTIGDPFTYFMYRTKNGVINTFKQNISARDGDVCTLTFQDNARRPIADSGTTTFDLDFVKKFHIADLNNVAHISTLSDKLMNSTNTCLCIENDNVYHFASDSIPKYINKIKFRVINNVMGSADAGFSNRNISKSKRKILFPFYAVSLIFPLADAIYMSIKNKDFSFMLHPLYCIATIFYIVKYMAFKLLGKDVKNQKY